MKILPLFRRLRRLFTPAVLLIVAGGGLALGGAAVSYQAGTAELVINGVSAGFILGYSGGDVRTRVVVEPAVAKALPKKHIGPLEYEPITVVVLFPPSQPILDWIDELAADKRTRKTLLLKEYDFDYKLRGVPLEAINAMLTEVRFPALDTGSKDQSRMTLVFTPESTHASAVAGAAAAATKGVPTGSSKGASSASFKLQVGKLPSAGIIRIDPFTIKQRADTGLGPPEFSNLILTMNAANSAEWTAWRDTFVVNGQSSDTDENSASLELFSANGTPLATLEFSQVGILRAALGEMEAGADQPRRFNTELYYERMKVGLAGSKSPAATAASAAPVAPKASSATDTAAAAAKADTAKAEADKAAAVASTTRKGAESRATAVAGAEGAAGSGIAKVTNAADQGARDPQDFPRPEGSVRKTYSSMRQPTQSQETIVYTSKSTLDGLDEFYTKSLTDAGWEPGNRFENNNAVGSMHQIISNWKSTLRTVAITLVEVKPSGAEISVNLTTKSP